jgi:hypothetical protein
MGCSPRQLEDHLSPTEQLHEAVSCAGGHAYSGSQVLPDYPRLGSQHPELKFVQTVPASSTKQQPKLDEYTAASLLPGMDQVHWQSQQLQGSVNACSGPLCLRQQSGHSDCGLTGSRQLDVEGDRPVSCSAADSSRGGACTGDRGQGHIQQSVWVWWEWRPDDSSFMAAFVQVGCLVWHGC